MSCSAMRPLSTRSGSARPPCNPVSALAPSRQRLTAHRAIRCRGILDHYRAQQAEKEQTRVETFGDDGGEDEEPCPVECVQQVYTPKEFKTACQEAKDALVVVDFFKTSCGACKYIQPGFVKLCKSTHEEHPEVLFVKHNVYDDEEEETTDLSRRLSIKAVPMFQFYRNMELIDSFATRDRVRLAKAINKHTGADTVHVMKEDE